MNPKLIVKVVLAAVTLVKAVDELVKDCRQSRA